MLMENLISLQGFMNENPVIFVALLIWSLAWKGVALWKSARLSHKTWFIALLIVNTIGILEIIYIYFVARKYSLVTRIESAEDEKIGVGKNGNTSDNGGSGSGSEN